MQQLDVDVIGLPWTVAEEELAKTNYKYIHYHTKPPKEMNNLNEKSSYVIRQAHDSFGNCIIITANKMDKPAVMAEKHN